MLHAAASVNYSKSVRPVQPKSFLSIRLSLLIFSDIYDESFFKLFCRLFCYPQLGTGFLPEDRRIPGVDARGIFHAR